MNVLPSGLVWWRFRDSEGHVGVNVWLCLCYWVVGSGGSGLVSVQLFPGPTCLLEARFSLPGALWRPWWRKFWVWAGFSVKDFSLWLELFGNARGGRAQSAVHAIGAWKSHTAGKERFLDGFSSPSAEMSSRLRFGTFSGTSWLSTLQFHGLEEKKEKKEKERETGSFVNLGGGISCAAAPQPRLEAASLRITWF